MNRPLIIGALMLPGLAFARAPTGPELNYSYGELRYVDLDENGGDRLRISGSYDLNNNWIIVGGLRLIYCGGWESRRCPKSDRLLAAVQRLSGPAGKANA